MDISVPNSANNTNNYPILHLIPKLLTIYPNLNILVIPMFTKRSLILSVMEGGASDYILIDDSASLINLDNMVLTVANDGIHFSPNTLRLFLKTQLAQDGEELSPRQKETLSLCTAYPNATSNELCSQMGISNSTFRNMLSVAYVKRNVRTRAATMSRAQSLGIINTLHSRTKPDPRLTIPQPSHPTNLQGIGKKRIPFSTYRSRMR